MQIEVKEAIYLGSCAERIYGIGTLIRGKSVREMGTGFLMECLDGEWIRIFSYVRVVPGADPVTLVFW